VDDAKVWIENWRTKQRKQKRSSVVASATRGQDKKEKQPRGSAVVAKASVSPSDPAGSASPQPNKSKNNVQEAKRWIDDFRSSQETRQWIDNWRSKESQRRRSSVVASAASGASSSENVEDAKKWIDNWQSSSKKKKDSTTTTSKDTSGSRVVTSATSSNSSEASSGGAAGRLEAIFKVLPNERNNRSLWGVGLMQMLWTASTLMYVSVLPIYMKQELGLSMTKIGVLEGAAIAAAFFSKVFSGIISDALRSRTAVIFVGAMLTLACKPMFAASAYVKTTFGTAVCFYWIFSGKIADRLSKGIRAAPTDALLADLSPGSARSKAFSLTQSLATFGGVLGSALTAALLFKGFSYETIFMLAAVPSALAIVTLFTAVKQPELEQGEGAEEEKDTATKKDSGGFKQVLKNASTLPWQFYFSAIIVSTLYVARFSESFVVLRAKSLGWSTAALPLLLTSNQILQGFFTYPMGVLADKLGKKQILTLGFLLLVVANLTFIYTKHPAGAVVGFLIVGLHMSMTQANTKALLTEYINPTQRGTAFATFAVLSGFSLSFGNTLAGVLNDKIAGIGCFVGGACFTILATILLQVYFLVNKSKPAAN
jgi:MFS family permease